MIELISAFIEPLNARSIRYLVTGSVAAMAYGEPRLTNDIDLILEIRPADIPSLVEAFPESHYYLPPVEVLQTEQARSLRGHFNIFHLETMLKADIYLAGSDPLHHRAFQKQVKMDIDGTPVSFAPPEYVILRKLEFFREGGSEKHLRDIASILNESGNEIDKSYLNDQVQLRGLSDAWQKAEQISET